MEQGPRGQSVGGRSTGLGQDAERWWWLLGMELGTEDSFPGGRRSLPLKEKVRWVSKMTKEFRVAVFICSTCTHLTYIFSVLFVSNFKN